MRQSDIIPMYEDVLSIFTLKQMGLTKPEMAEYYGVSPNVVDWVIRKMKRQKNGAKEITIYLTDHAYKRLCERTGIFLSKTEAIVQLNRDMQEGIMQWEYVRLSGYNLDIRTENHNGNLKCVTIVNNFIPIRDNRRPPTINIKITWLDWEVDIEKSREGDISICDMVLERNDKYLAKVASRLQYHEDQLKGVKSGAD